MIPVSWPGMPAMIRSPDFVIEMLIDWKAASERHAEGDIYKSIEINAKRFALGQQTVDILVNTAKEMGW